MIFVLSPTKPSRVQCATFSGCSDSLVGCCMAAPPPSWAPRSLVVPTPGCALLGEPGRAPIPGPRSPGRPTPGPAGQGQRTLPLVPARQDRVPLLRHARVRVHAPIIHRDAAIDCLEQLYYAARMTRVDYFEISCKTALN